MARFVRITSTRPGFRRGGLAHPPAPVDHPAEAIGERQLAQLLAEASLPGSPLTVELVETEEPPPEGAGTGQDTREGADASGGASASPPRARHQQSAQDGIAIGDGTDGSAAAPEAGRPRPTGEAREGEGAAAAAASPSVPDEIPEQGAPTGSGDAAPPRSPSARTGGGRKGRKA